MNRKTKKQVVDAIKSAIKEVGDKRLAKKQFLSKSDFKLSDILRYFPNWSEALKAAGADYQPWHQKIPLEDLLSDWGLVVRELGQIPTLTRYKLMGRYSPNVFERNFGSWSAIPAAFNKYAAEIPEWNDVLEIVSSQLSIPKRKKTDQNITKRTSSTTSTAPTVISVRLVPLTCTSVPVNVPAS